MFTFLPVPAPLDPKLILLLLNLCLCAAAWPHSLMGDNCPSSEWSVMCRPCCEYHLIQCRCPSTGSRVGYTVPCCRNALNQCDPCIFHPGCSLFENCKTCHNGTWKANDDFFVKGRFCKECRQGWSGGDCKTCGGFIQRTQGHVALESYPTNARCEWTVRVPRGSGIELSNKNVLRDNKLNVSGSPPRGLRSEDLRQVLLRFSRLSLEPDHSCRYDYVEVRDGAGLSSPVIGRFCGDQLPPPIKSSGNVLHVLFTSDGYNNFDGFVLTFQESSVSAVMALVCAPPEKLVNGYLLPAYGLREELVSVNYRCHPPFTLSGSQQRTCLPNGTWSGTDPTCVKGQTSRVPCATPPKLLNGYHRRALEAAGDAETIEFFCKNSYILSGNHRSTCLSNGSWSSRLPTCVRACREPKVSELVQQTVVKPHLLSRESPHQSARYSVHDLLRAGFLPLAPDGQSGSGGRDAAREELPRGFHSVHTSIEYRCASPLYRHTGSSRRTCLTTGRWSGRHVSCAPVCGRFNTFSLHNLSDTQWPWHTAVYVRSPPDHAARSRGSDRRGATEESAVWYLACSGALLTQRSVLVAAQCVVNKDGRRPVHTAHVKVVTGAQHQSSKGRMKSQHHLRVSDIVVHPNFYSAPDSNLAVLKLKDKAKISERVLPVCLPEMQGGEVTAQQAYTARWVIPNDRRQLSRYAAASQTRPVEPSDVARCERESARGGTRTAAISDNMLCVVRKPAGPESPCPAAVPGLTAVPAASSSTSGVSSGHEETAQAASATGWQLLSLESFSYEENNCRQQTYTAQTRIGNFRDWIVKNMN